MTVSFFVPFGVSFFVLCLAERVLHVILSLFSPLQPKDGGLRAQMVVGSFVNVGGTLVGSTLSLVSQCLYLVGWMAVWFLVLFCVFSMWHVLYEENPSIVIYFVEYYNARIGPFVHAYLLFPLELINMLVKGILPVYNGALWLARTLFNKGVLPVILSQMTMIMDMAVVILSFGKHSSDAIQAFVRDLGCENDACLTKPAVLDVMSAMNDVRILSLVATRVGMAMCSILSVPVELVLYPLQDLYFARGIHSLVNGILHLVFHVPYLTGHRCTKYGSVSSVGGVLMCTPDLEPVFTHLVSGVRDLGTTADNWIGVGASIARRSVTGVPDSCTVKTLSPDSFRADGLLSGAMTVVGLTDWLMAATNGSMAYFFGQVNTDAAPRLWPGEIDVRMGVAAVGFGEVNNVEVSSLTQGRRPGSRQTTTMMGCRCDDGAGNSGGIRVRCHFLPLSGSIAAAEAGMDVWFQDQAWVSHLTCASVEISVRSVRWPVRRYEGKSVPFGVGGTEMPNGDCLTQGTCEKVDATIWLVPRCDVLPAEQCSDVAVGTSCFPFCVATRVSGSRNANPVFVNAQTWRTGKQLLMRDCALQDGGVTDGSSAVVGSLAVSRSSATTIGFGQTTLSGVSGDAPLFVRGTGSTCTLGSNTASWVSSSSTAGIISFIRRRRQPFAIGGDTILLEDLQSDGVALVEVERLTGDQRDEYTLRRGWYGLPAAPKRLVPAQELSMDERNRIVVPMEYVATRVPATTSRNYMFYAVNPDLQIFEAYLDYCRDRTKLPRIQLMALSSYGPLRVYRVRAYCQENCQGRWADLSAQYTFSSFSEGEFTDTTFFRDCWRVYNASIDALEYVNEQNIAVVVQVADWTYDVKTRSGANSKYKTYWLNPQTMEVRNDTMWPTEIPASLTTNLCAAGDSVPHLGSLAAGLLNSGIHVINFAVGGFVYSPGLIALWRGGSKCPPESRGHSVVASCGSSAFSLDDFFDSLDDAVAIFWGIPMWLGDQLRQGGVAEFSPVGDLLQGLGIFGKEATGVSGMQDGILGMLNTPLPGQVAGAWALVRNPGGMAGAAQLTMGASALARYTARLTSQSCIDMIKAVSAGELSGIKEMWTRFLSVLYDSRSFFKSSVSDRASGSCKGLQVMMGGSTPWGNVLYHGCRGGLLLLGGMMDLSIHIFVDAPMVKCVCKDSMGHTVGAFARENCVYKTPKTLRPVLLGMIAAADQKGGSDALICPAVISYTRDAMSATMEPWFGSVYSMLDALGDSIDYALVGFDNDAGQCMDFQQDPQVVVIMPEPVDYFQACGATTSCRTKCAGTWSAFSSEVAKRDPLSLRGVKEVEQSVESKFFPTAGVDMVAPGNIKALTQPKECSGVCRSPDDQCLAVAFVSPGATSLNVRYYCVPSSPSASVYRSETESVNWDAAMPEAEVTQYGFIDTEGSSLAILTKTQLLMMQRGLSSSRALADSTKMYSLNLMGQYAMRMVDFMVVRDRLLVNVAVRTNSEGEFERSVSTIWVNSKTEGELAYWPWVVNPPLREVWMGYAVSEYPREDISAGSGVEGSVTTTLLLWPVTAAGTLQRVRVVYEGNTSVKVASIEPFQQGQSLMARASLLPRQLVLSKTLRVSSGRLSAFASSGETFDWLQQLRLSGDDLMITGSTLGNSQSVSATVSIATGCDGLDCRGCPDLGLRALCASYQSCAIFRCIGTPVNLKRPLCGIGQVLRSTGLMAVETVHGGWIMFVDIYMILLQLATQKNIPGVDVTFPDDAFLGYMCTAKDLSAEFFGILSSTVNSALQKAQVPAVLLQTAAQLDSNANTAMSISAAAVTGFMNQLALLPVYTMIIGHKIMMCQVSGTIAVASARGFRVDLLPARFSATDAIGGQCLTRGAETEAEQTGDATSMRGVSATAGSILSHAGESAMMRQLEPLMHMVDGWMTYMIGVVGKFADVMQAFDVKQCMLPDVTLKTTVRCACGDKAVSILPARRVEGISDFAYWCTGTISLVNEDNKVQIVWNPYTFGELQAKLARVMDAYVQKASESMYASAPNDPVFSKQGVSMIAVLTRCRQNYVNQQWDPAAYARYDQSILNKVISGSTPRAASKEDGVGACLLDSVSKGVGNGACLDSFMMSRGHTPLYWSYVPTNSTDSSLIDGCLVFSGPAANVSVIPPRRKVFQDCLAGYSSESAGSSRCDLSGFVWSPASSNDVPVAARHVIASTNGAMVDAVAQRMEAARDMVMSELAGLVDYSNPELEAAMFSAEGDVIHQLMDCVFMGPYARMDYWPGQRCNESETPDCLVGPYWSRDAWAGATRRLDIETCPASNTLPFTCGSPTRRAVIKDFVQRYLQAGSNGTEMLVELVRAWLADQSKRWRNVSKFGCDCPDNSSNDVRCCRPDIGSHLPAALSEAPMYLPTQGVMNAIGKRLKFFYAEALWTPEAWITHLSSDEMRKYDWTNSAGSHRVVSDAMYDTVEATMKFDGSEAASPPRTLLDPGLWKACHGALRQMLFSIPVSENGQLRDAVPEFPGGGPDAIAAHVKEIVKGAFASSPLFRHYHAKHHPSESRMCEGAPRSTQAAGTAGSVTFADYSVNGNLILDARKIAGIPVLGFEQSALGAWNRSCFCGWRQSEDGSSCTVPAAICEEVRAVMAAVTQTCTFSLSDQKMAVLSAAFRPGVWTCPLLELSEHLGFLDPASTEAWLRGGRILQTSGEFLLRYGPGGLKVGNTPGGGDVELDLGADFPRGDLAQVLQQYMKPGNRLVDPARAVLHGCQEWESVAQHGGSLLDDFLDTLFPMAHAVPESGVSAYCLRYAIELARLQTMELMPGIDLAEMVKQKEVLAVWRRRCGSQVQLVGMCSALDIYHSGGIQPTDCLQPWQVVLETSVEMYVTPQCLVKIGDYFYDPCVCNPAWCEKPTTDVPIRITRADLESTRCRMRFDPRTVVRSAELGWWGLDETHPAAAASNEWLADPWNLLDLDGLERTLLYEKADGAGNVPAGKSWFSAEGFMNETGAFCDAIADYWPEDWLFPVGYHATVPCDKEDTGYRSFDNVFALDEAEETDGTPVMTYLEDQTRDGNYIDSHFGAGGICRGTNFGFDMYETNTMRVCTRISDVEDVDIHVPRGESSAFGNLGLPRCSRSSTELPWGDERYYNYYDAAFYSVGTVPNLPSESAKTYPETPDRYMQVGPQHDMEAFKWGDECQDFALPNCSSPDRKWRCPAGFVCRGDGVCQHPSVQCTRHDECDGEKMCSGVGTCVNPRITVQNDLSTSASFRAHTTECAGDSFSMRGASAWGYMPDLLPAHGMCSYRHWREYLYTLDKCNCMAPGAEKDNNQCKINGTSCKMYRFSKISDEKNMWWDPNNVFPNRMKMLPTTCDRDYERFAMDGKEMRSCVPSKTRVRVMNVDNTYRLSAGRDRMWKAYDEDAKTIAMRRMPYANISRSFGFLGFGAEPNLRSCTSVQQCFVDTFTKNGRVSMTTRNSIAIANRTLMNGAQYNPDHTFQCGVIGYFDQNAGTCRVDKKLFPLYHLMCFDDNSMKKCLPAMSITSATLAQKCSNVIEEYPQQYSIIHDVNVPALAEFFKIFRAPTTLREHFSTVECMNHVYSMISKPPFESRGLYIPFTFTVYEIPFPWFYQCMIGASIQPPSDLTKVVYACPFYLANNTLEKYEPLSNTKFSDFSSYIFNLRAGYVESVLQQKVNGQLETAKGYWRAAVNQLKTRLYGDQDKSYPRCYTEKRWNLPTENLYIVKLIETYERPSCASNTRGEFLKRYAKMYNRMDLNMNNIIDELTVNSDPMEQQGNVDPLLTERIMSFGVKYLEKQANVESLINSQPPVRFSPLLPENTSFVFMAERDSWKAFNYMPNAVDSPNPVSTTCPSMNRVKLYTGKIAHLDTDKQAGLPSVNGEEPAVTVCPVYTKGFFGCGYDNITIKGVTYSLNGKSRNIEREFNTFVGAMYEEARSIYNVMLEKNPMASFPPEKLAFFEEESSLAFGDFAFNLASVVTYMNNIDPDVKTPVMCVAGDKTIDYNNCTDSNYHAIREHVTANYLTESATVIPDSHQLDWDVSKQMMSKGAIFSFASTERNISRQFMGRLMDSASVCQAGDLSHSQRICSFTKSGALQKALSVSPWMAGMWNPYDQCDVTQLSVENGNTEKIDVQCYYNEFCPGDRVFDTTTVPYYGEMPYKATCIARNDEKTNHINVDSGSAYNLCQHSLFEDSVCQHVQGMLGGTDGMPSEDFNPNGDLYTLHEFTGIPDGDGGPFGNVLLAGRSSKYGFVRISSKHIGGDHLGFEISAGGTMRVSRMPLKPVKSGERMPQWDTQDVQDWVEKWNVSMEEDHLLYASAMRDVGFTLGNDARGYPKLSWDCPLKRRAFYSGGVKGFRPSLPSARRSRRLFGDMTGNRHAHPTQVHMEATEQFGKYLTTNGFCLCPMSEDVWPGMCSVKTDLSENHNCSLNNTVRAIKGEAWGWSHTFRPKNAQNEYKTCEVQLDWPFVSAMLRDGSNLSSTDVNDTIWNGASDIEARRCHVLDRIPDFAYVYASKRELKPSGTTTLENGVCHTARVQKRARSVVGRCVRASKGELDSLIRCVNGTKIRVERRQSTPAREAADSTRSYRRACSRCTKPPVFRTRDGAPIQAESSFGVPYRVSAERVAARDLRDALCPGGAKDCIAKLNASAWKSGEFMRMFMGNPVGLFQPGVASPQFNSSSKYRPKADKQPDDSALWEKPWVYCPSKDALATGVNCTGFITKARWREAKVDACYTTVEGILQGQPDPMAKTQICELDGRLGTLCRVIREAQSLVASANCIASGSEKCALQEFVYSPATWETTNQAFVHQTVEEFYKRVDGCTSDADCICGTDPALAAFRQSNARAMKGCAAVPVMVFQRVLVAIRGMIVPLCQVIATAFNLVLNLLLTMVTSGHTDALNQALLDWHTLKTLMSGATSNIADMIFDLAFSSGTLGPWLRVSIETACHTVNSVYMYVADFWCRLVVQQLPIFLGGLREIGGWMDVGFEVVDDVFRVILHEFMPEALMALYQAGYKEYFQSEKYKEKQAAYEERVKLNTGNTDGQGRPLTMDERQQRAANSESRVMKNLASSKKQKDAGILVAVQAGLEVAGGPVAVVAEIINLGITGYQLFQQYQTAKLIAETLEKFPRTLTIFDFDSFYAAIDGLVAFLNADFTCYSMNPESPPVVCSSISLPKPNNDTIYSMAPRASTCWAEAQQRQVGVSTLYACSATSTCCDDALTCDDPAKNRICGECPLPLAGVRQYGCNTMIQRCQCGIESFEVDRCVAQRDCGPTASCSLLTNLDDMSFGAMKSCTDCAVSPVCLIGSSQHYGQCTCLNGANAKVDLCDASTMGAVVSTNPSRLCGFAPDPGTYFSWSELSLVSCVNAISPTCAEVMSDSGTVIYMPVSTRLRSIQVSYGGGGRRLLSVDEPTHMRLPSVFSPEDPADDLTPEMLHAIVVDSKWNHTSAPCGTLAHAYIQGQRLGPVDESSLHACVYWRFVAQQMIREYNLTSLAKLDTFLLSPDDLSFSIGQKGVLAELLRKPHVLLVAAMYSPWMKPIRAVLTASHDANVSALISGWVRKLKGETKSWIRREKIVDTIKAELGNETANFVSDHGPRRRLLGKWEETEMQVQAMPYYPLVRSSSANITIFAQKNTSSASLAVAETFLRDSFTLSGASFASTCAVAESLATSTIQTVMVVQTYYSKFDEINGPRNKARSLRESLPIFKAPTWSNFSSSSATPNSATASFGSTVLDTTLGIIGMSRKDLIYFLSEPCPGKNCAAANQWTFSYMLEALTFCDLESVMYCSRYKRDITVSILFALILYVIISALANFVGFPSLATMFFYAIPFFVLWFSTGVAPSCVPLVPTCIIDDIIGFIKEWLPFQMGLPKLLIVNNNNNSARLRPCTDLSFTSWEDPLAFALCDMGFCDELNDTTWMGTRWDFSKKLSMIRSQDASAYRVCSTVAAVNVLPVAMAAVTGVALLSCAVIALSSLIGPLLGLAWQVSVYNHQPGEQDISEQ